MRYIVVWQAMARSWEQSMRVKGVDESTIESWGIYFNQLTIKVATCKTNELQRVGQELVSAFKTAMWYMEKAEGK